MQVYRIEYDGQILVSLNQYKSLHWRKLKKLIDPMKMQFLILLKKEKIPQLEFIEIRVYHNTRLDTDNVTGMIKPFVDMMRKAEVISDDTFKQWDYLSIQFDKTLKRKTVIFEITGKIKL